MTLPLSIGWKKVWSNVKSKFSLGDFMKINNGLFC